MAKMSDHTLLTIVEARSRDAEGMGGTLASERQTALRYYRGDKFGDEQEGRSQVVSRDVAESIDATLPSLMRIFASGDQVVMFEPHGQEDERAAEQATDYANYIWNKQNAGFRIFYWWFKDALLQKLGIVKIWWDASEKTTREEYTGLTKAQADELAADPDIEIIEESDPYYDDEDGDEAQQIPLAPPMPGSLPLAGPPPMPVSPMGMAAPGLPLGAAPMGVPGAPPVGPAGMLPPGGAPPMMPGLPMLPPPKPQLVDITVKRTNKTGKICVENVPNEEFGMSRRATSVEDADYTHHRRKMTLSDLRAMGYPQSKIDKIPTDDIFSMDQEKAERFDDQGGTSPEETGVMDPSMRVVWLTESYLRVDCDGDGIAEMRKVTWAGNQIFDNEETDDNPFACCTPTLMPHKAVGLSMADQVMDLQRVKSTLWRNFLDNVYLQSAPALAVHDDQVIDYNEWLTRRVGQILRTKGPPAAAFAALPTQFVGGEVFPAIEYIDSVREQRTGSTRYNQGLDANSLNKTASGINMIQQAAGQRIELIARSFAETGVKPAFKKLIKLASQYSERKEVIRLRGKWVDVDPRAWTDGFDMSVSVGLGTGNKDQQVMHMMALMQLDEKIVMLQKGVQGPLLDASGIYKKLEKLVQAMGMHSVEPFYTDPESPKGQAAMQAAANQPPQPTPELMAINLQQQLNAATAENNKNKLQVDAMDKQASHQLAERKQTADEQFKARELAIREREAAIKEQELGIKNSELGIKNTEIGVRADLEHAKLADVREARAMTQAQEMALARAQMRQVDGEPGPVELLAQQQQGLSRVEQIIADLQARIAQPKRGRMIKRGDGVYDFHVEAPGANGTGA
jgi:hypothetical protein